MVYSYLEQILFILQSLILCMISILFSNVILPEVLFRDTYYCICVSFKETFISSLQPVLYVEMASSSFADFSLIDFRVFF